MMSVATPQLYREVAGRLLDAVGTAGYFSGSVAFTVGDTDCRLVVSVIVYHAGVTAPDGVGYPISDLVPVWWEFHTVTAQGEVPNDFSFNEMKTYAIA